jgi:hypothetical protein
MVRRGSPVRVRKRAFTKAPQTRGFCFADALHFVQRARVWNRCLEQPDEKGCDFVVYPGITASGRGWAAADVSRFPRPQRPKRYSCWLERQWVSLSIMRRRAKSLRFSPYSLLAALPGNRQMTGPTLLPAPHCPLVVERTLAWLPTSNDCSSATTAAARSTKPSSPSGVALSARSVSPLWADAVADAHRHAVCEGLVDDAVALGQR